MDDLFDAALAQADAAISDTMGKIFTLACQSGERVSVVGIHDYSLKYEGHEDKVAKLIARYGSITLLNQPVTREQLIGAVVSVKGKDFKVYNPLQPDETTLLLPLSPDAAGGFDGRLLSD